MSNWREKRRRMVLTKEGYGHWRVNILSSSPSIHIKGNGQRVYNERVIKSCTTTNAMAIDDFMSDESEYDGRYLRIKSGTEELWAEVQRKHQLDRKLSKLKNNKQ
jgi:hypothetical protein